MNISWSRKALNGFDETQQTIARPTLKQWKYSEYKIDLPLQPNKPGANLPNLVLTHEIASKTYVH